MFLAFIAVSEQMLAIYYPLPVFFFFFFWICFITLDAIDDQKRRHNWQNTMIVEQSTAI